MILHMKYGRKPVRVKPETILREQLKGFAVKQVIVDSRDMKWMLLHSCVTVIFDIIHRNIVTGKGQLNDTSGIHAPVAKFDPYYDYEEKKACD